MEPTSGRGMGDFLDKGNTLEGYKTEGPYLVRGVTGKENIIRVYDGMLRQNGTTLLLCIQTKVQTIDF